jgi:hypothetical protein
MTVMHEAREALLTIVQVLLYDPLYVWTMSPARACKLQQLRAADPEASEMNTSRVNGGYISGNLQPEGTVKGDMFEEINVCMFVRNKCLYVCNECFYVQKKLLRSSLYCV